MCKIKDKEKFAKVMRIVCAVLAIALGIAIGMLELVSCSTPKVIVSNGAHRYIVNVPNDDTTIVVNP